MNKFHLCYFTCIIDLPALSSLLAFYNGFSCSQWAEPRPYQFAHGTGIAPSSGMVGDETRISRFASLAPEEITLAISYRELTST